MGLMEQGASGSRIDMREDPSLKGILGAYPGSGGGRATSSLSDPTGEPPHAEGNTGAYRLETTDSLHELSDGGAVAIFGRPHFRDRKLAELAMTSNPAKALAEGYLEFAEGIFSRVSGSYSCAIIDTGAQRVLAAIDRRGQHSL
jgi:hypothetical protein